VLFLCGLFNQQPSFASNSFLVVSYHSTEQQTDNDVMDLLAKLEDSADTIESLINQEEVNKQTIECLG
jgi:hypothetical protein